MKLRVAPVNYKRAGLRFSDNKSFFAAATIISYLFNRIGLPQTWKEDLNALFVKYPNVEIAELGFPPKWHETVGW